MQEGKIVKRKYAADKPSECRYCYFWRGKRKGCGRTMGENGSCQGCVYGKHAPCIGYCMKKLLLEMKQKKGGQLGKEEN